MTNERTLTTNKILVGNDLIEEYLFDETKKVELEKGLQNLVNNLCEMIEAKDEGIFTTPTEHGMLISLSTDTVYDMIDDMYLSLSWEAPRWGKATDRTHKSFAYETEKVILAYEIALKLGVYTDSVLFNLGTNNVKRMDFEDWYCSPDEQRKAVYEVEHELIQADEIFIPNEIIEAEDVYDLPRGRIIKISSVLEACKDYNFDTNDMLEITKGLFAYPEENGDGYIVDAEDFEGMLLNDTITHCQVTNCYYWRNENNKIQLEAINFKNDPDQHERQVEAGHHVIYNTMYLIAPYTNTYFGEL